MRTCESPSPPSVILEIFDGVVGNTADMHRSYEGDDEQKKPDVIEDVKPATESLHPQSVPTQPVQPESPLDNAPKHEDVLAAFDSSNDNHRTSDAHQQQQQHQNYFPSHEQSQDMSSYNDQGFPATVGIKEDG